MPRAASVRSAMSAPITRVPQLDLGAEYRALGPAVTAAIKRAIAHTAFIGGEEVDGFEREFAAYLGVRHALGVGNGTDALELALQALGIGPGDAVLTVPFTFAAPLEAIVRSGATPVLCDVRADDCTIDVDAAAAVFRQRPIKAVIAVHLYGHPADMHNLLPLARSHGAAVIEDAAQAHGAWCSVDGQRRRVGGIGDAACFSFYPSKNLGAMGDGGAVTTNRDDVAERLRLLARHGDAGKYHHVIANGRNSRLDALQAAVLRLKLPHLEAWNRARRHVAAQYHRQLGNLPLRLPAERPGAEPVYHQYAVRGRDRDALRQGLAARGIDTSIHYPLSLHQQPGFRDLGYPPEAFPIARRCAADVLSLPMSPFLDDAAIAYVADSMRTLLT